MPTLNCIEAEEKVTNPQRMHYKDQELS